MNPRYLLGCFILGALLSAPTAEARHNNSVDTSDLDNDPVAEFPVPVLFGVAYDSLVPDFGDPRGDGTRSHEGQDMRAPQGTPIVSPTEAIVLRTGVGASAGKYVYTANPGGEVFRYMHLDYIADLDRGDVLAVGDFIGTVGDTGNAPVGTYHLHFEVRRDNQPTDPYERLTDTFTLREKVTFLKDIFRDIREDEAYADFLVETFPAVFKTALAEDYSLPAEIKDALEESGVYDSGATEAQLAAVLARIPQVLTMELVSGDQGPAVSLLQLYIMYTSDGAARDALVAAGATGYFGPITTAAVAELQALRSLTVTGVYNSATRTGLLP